MNKPLTVSQERQTRRTFSANNHMFSGGITSILMAIVQYPTSRLLDFSLKKMTNVLFSASDAQESPTISRQCRDVDVQGPTFKKCSRSCFRSTASGSARFMDFAKYAQTELNYNLRGDPRKQEELLIGAFGIAAKTTSEMRARGVRRRSRIAHATDFPAVRHSLLLHRGNDEAACSAIQRTHCNISVTNQI